MPTVFRWHAKREFKCHFHFSFSHDIEKQIWILLFVFRFRLTLKNGFELRISFFAFTLKNGYQFQFSFFVFASLWKTDMNFVFFFSFSHYFEKRIWISFVIFAWLEKGITAPVQSFETPATPSGWERGIYFLCNWKQVNFSLPGAKVISKLPPPPSLQWYVLHTHGTPFLTMDDKWYDSREKTRSYRNTCISSMEKENDEHLNTLQLEVTKCEITKNYKSGFTVFWSFCRMTQSLQSVLLVVISRIQQITTS